MAEFSSSQVGRTHHRIEGTTLFFFSLSDLATLRGPALLCGADKRAGDVVILSPMKGTGSSGEMLLLITELWAAKIGLVFSDASLIH